MSQVHWENLLKELLGEESPCVVCAVKVMCGKSFSTRKGGGCPELKDAIKEALMKKNLEDDER